MNGVRFRDVVAAEFARRQQLNPRYSLRGFARALGVHHATVSRLLTRDAALQAATLSTIGPRLGLSSIEIRSLIAREDVELVIGAVERQAFRPRSRWLATVSGLPIDRVNIALQTLLCTGRLKMLSTTEWSVIRQGEN